MDMRKPKIPLTAARAREAWDYDEEMGRLIWKKWGKVGGCLRSDGYRVIRIDEWNYQEHRVVWLWKTGAWPAACIDHIDGVRDNNRFANLRDTTLAVNAQNQRRASSASQTGFLGVKASGGKFQARIFSERKRLILGTFPRAEEAHAAYIEAKRRLHAGCTL